MTNRKISKKSLTKCKGFAVAICGKCARQDDEGPRLVSGLAHGKCEHFVR
jgi:hypothetical protein